MPEVKELQTEEQAVQAEIADLYKQLTGQERRTVATALNADMDTLRRYASADYGVKKLATGILMRDVMKKVLAERSTSIAA